MFVYSKNDVYSPKFLLYTYSHDMYRIVKINSCRNKGFEQIGKTYDVNSDEVKRVSLSRTKRSIREYSLCNDFTHFATLTINSENCDRYSLDTCQELLKKIIKKLKRKYSDFIYLFITEKHKDGAFHFHGLIGGVPDEFFYTNNFGYLSNSTFSEFLGFNSFSKIRDYVKCCNYILKYITKDCIKNSHNQIYICSRGLKKPSVEEFNHIDFVPSYENDFCSLRDINLNDLSQTERIEFLYKFLDKK